jgi:hypothetical protein
MNPFDEVRRESMELPRASFPKPSPLPWLLLALGVVLTVTVLVVARSRLQAEQERSALALKANDELLGKNRALQEKLDASEQRCAGAGAATSEQAHRMLQLELQNRALQAELAKSRRR